MQKRKLIEVALPLEAINRESAREKSIRHGHPSTLHLWWARRPLAAARAVLFAQLVDDPSSHPDRFPTEEDQRAERERLHNIIERLVVWENIRDEKLFAEAHAEILASCDGNPPPILDPFAGGGTIPLEAQRLGLEAHASDLNPVAVLINKALIEIPPKFRDQPPVFPGLADSEIRTWKGTEGLAADVRAYGEWMRDEAEKRIGHLYPKATLTDGSQATVIAWIWARTVTCPNPACGIEMPLVRSWLLGKKRGKEAYVDTSIVADPSHSSGKRVKYSVESGVSSRSLTDADGTVGRQGAICVACRTAVPLTYVRGAGKKGRIGARLIAMVAEGVRRRIYLAASDEQEAIALAVAPSERPEGTLPAEALGFRIQAYGMRTFSDLFSNRQIAALTTLGSLVEEVRELLLKDAGSDPSFKNASEVESYADAVSTYLAIAVSRMTDYQSAFATWSNHPKNEVIVHVFGRQAIPMTWDYAEGNPLLMAISGSFMIMVRAVVNCMPNLPSVGQSRSVQSDAAQVLDGSIGGLISTDPPYYDNVSYSHLSDYFYVWLRYSIRGLYPELFGTILVPKSAELVADPYRHQSVAQAKVFFEEGFRTVFERARNSALPDFPITVYYAFKQSDSSHDEEASSGWETLLEGMLKSGWEITATWPVRTESAGRLRATGSNALASSIVLALRPRRSDAAATDRRTLIESLHAELPGALRRLQQGQIAPVDLPQAAIGPGMAVFSRYSKVVEADGSVMTVRSALARINEILDEVLAEQEGDFDSISRFAIAWYRQHGYGTGVFGGADDLARARNTTVELMDRHGILTSRAGKVTLIKSADLPANYDPAEDPHTSNWEALHHLIRTLEVDGIPAAGGVLASATSRQDGAVDADLVKELAFLLFSIAEKNGWAKDALSFNALAQSWPDIVSASREAGDDSDPQGTFDYPEDEDD